MIYYKLVKITINTLGLAKVIINMIMRYYSPLRLNNHQPGVALYLEIQVIAMLFLWH